MIINVTSKTLLCLVAGFLELVTIYPSMAGEPWSFGGGNAGDTFYYPTLKPADPGDTLDQRTIKLDKPAKNSMLCGDVLGDGSSYLIYAVSNPNTVIALNVLTGESIRVLLEDNVYLQGTTWDDTPYETQLINYDDNPGLELLCFVGSEKVKPLFQIVSFQQKKVAKSFYGEGRGVSDGGIGWSGTENLIKAFKDTTSQWKFITSASTGRPDLTPREIRIYDEVSRKLESKFSISASPTHIAYWQPQGQNPLILLTTVTPCNDSFPTAPHVDLNGIETSDLESYELCFKYNPTLAAAGKSLELQWYPFRAKFVSGYSAISTDSKGRVLGIVSDYVIREFDPASPGKMHVYDMLSGNIINEFAADPGLSFGTYILAAANTDHFYGIIQEEARLQKFDVNKGMIKELDYSADPTVKLRPLGLTDIDGDGKYEILIAKNTPRTSELVILDQELNEKAEIPVPQVSFCVFADADNNRFPELYVMNGITNQEITVIEYTSNISNMQNYQYLR